MLACDVTARSEAGYRLADYSRKDGCSSRVEHRRTIGKKFDVVGISIAMARIVAHAFRVSRLEPISFSAIAKEDVAGLPWDFEYGGRHSCPTAAYGTATPSRPTSRERPACS